MLKFLYILFYLAQQVNLRKSILALSVVAGIVAAPMTVFAAHTHSWGSPQYYGYEDEMPGIYDDWDKCATRHVYNYKQCLICGEVSILPASL